MNHQGFTTDNNKSIIRVTDIVDKQEDFNRICGDGSTGSFISQQTAIDRLAKVRFKLPTGVVLEHTNELAWILHSSAQLVHPYRP
jgi:hypothetical protein